MRPRRRRPTHHRPTATNAARRWALPRRHRRDRRPPLGGQRHQSDRHPPARRLDRHSTRHRGHPLAREDRDRIVVTARHATLADVASRADAVFAPSADVRIGAEVEWLVFDRSDPTRRIDAADSARIALVPLPAGGTVTIEPGGQVELVTPPHDGPRQLIDAIETDTRVLARRFDDHGLALVPLGLDPIREPVRTLDVARYEAMERHFLEVSPAGVRMMNLTASLQLNIDVGADPQRAWERAHAVAPVLAAAFANSPTTDGESYRPISNRMRIWAATDPTRTRSVGPSTDDWLPYIMAATVIPRDVTIGPAAL
ncbi:MAG: hypothetical protein GKR86_10935, partial [Ilumatobacter sp.]|nr:hypothetical protein [Ilumatobacter sp.]